MLLDTTVYAWFLTQLRQFTGSGNNNINSQYDRACSTLFNRYNQCDFIAMSPSVVETPFFSLYVLWFYSDTLKSVRAKKRVMDVTVTQTVPLPPLDDENIASECDNLNPYFFIYIAASLVTVWFLVCTAAIEVCPRRRLSLASRRRTSACRLSSQP